MSDLADRLDLKLSWRRTKKDLRKKGFYYHPYELELIEYKLEDWIAGLKDKISSGYHPSQSEIIDVPKPNWHLRKGTILTLEDSVLYSSLILDGINEIKDGIDWSSQNVRLSNDVIKSDGNNWTKPEINGWSNFRDKSHEYIDNGYSTVLFTDISSFYDTIEIDRLMSDLSSLKIKRDNRELLTECLQMWAQSINIGIPQGFKPSDILSEVYLNSIDERLKMDGFLHLRYSDDMRIFCEKKEDAIEALYHLTRLYREKGLNLQTAKSLILEDTQAITEMNGHTKIIAKIEDDLTYNIDPSMDPLEAYDDEYDEEEEDEEEDEEIDIESLIDAFEEYVEPNVSEKFDKTVFHYVINRFATAELNTAIDYCFKLIIHQPTETKYILDKYFSHLKNKKEIGEKLAKLLEEKKIKLEYQKFLILKWIWENEVHSSLISKTIYHLVQDRLIHHINLDYCLAYIGKYGDASSLDFIYTYFSQVHRNISRATILISINRMETVRRNSIYGRYTKDKCLNLAVSYAKSL